MPNSLFSVINKDNHKQITILGIKFKFRNSKEEVLKLQEELKKVKKHFNVGLIDNINGSFRKYFIENNMPEKIALLKRGLDETSLKQVDITLNKMLYLPDLKISEYFYLDYERFMKDYSTTEDRKFAKLLEENKNAIKQKYKLSNNWFDFEVFLYHHGLKYANAKIKNYIERTDFIDAGANNGDSALVLLNYNPSKVHSFEISKECINIYKKTMEINNIPKDRYQINNQALGENNEIINVEYESRVNSNIFSGGESSIQKITLDKYAANYNIKFIKADVEGGGYALLKGAKQTIIKNRPVLCLSIYHTAEEFFETKILLDEIVSNSNYKINIECHNSDPRHIFGTLIWAYPKELAI